MAVFSPRSQKRKAVSPTPPEDEIDQEIRDMEMLHQQVQRKKEKMARLAELQRQIDEASEEVRHLAQDEQHRRPQHQDLHQEGFLNEDDWYDNFHHGNFVFDGASPHLEQPEAHTTECHSPDDIPFCRMWGKQIECE